MGGYIHPQERTSQDLVCLLQAACIRKVEERQNLSFLFCSIPYLSTLPKTLNSEHFAQSNGLTRGPPEVVHLFRLYRGRSHRRKNAAYPKFVMVWLYRLPIQVWGGDEGGNFLYQMISICLRYAVRKGGGVGTL
jgi:hypothetical protein